MKKQEIDQANALNSLKVVICPVSYKLPQKEGLFEKLILLSVKSNIELKDC